MGFRVVEWLYGSTHENEAMFGRASCERTGPDRLVGLVREIREMRRLQEKDLNASGRRGLYC